MHNSGDDTGNNECEEKQFIFDIDPPTSITAGDWSYVTHMINLISFLHSHHISHGSELHVLSLRIYS